MDIWEGVKGSKSGADPELDFGELNCLFYARGFFALLFAIRSIAVWEAMAPSPLNEVLPKIQIDKKVPYYFP